VCPSGEICHSGSCLCFGAFCDGVCVDTYIDTNNCGGCGNVCTGLGAYCLIGSCGNL
jgi:hypothetical protein